MLKKKRKKETRQFPETTASYMAVSIETTASYMTVYHTPIIIMILEALQ